VAIAFVWKGPAPSLRVGLHALGVADALAASPTPTAAATRRQASARTIGGA
jgi:hypothetical protein